MMTAIRRFLKDETAATAVEYGLIAAVLSLVIIGGVGQAADAIEYMFGDNNSKLNQAFSGN